MKMRTRGGADKEATRTVRLACGFGAVAMTAGLVLAAAGPAWADSGSGGTSAPTGQSDLGGWTLGSTAAGVSVFYEQPNFPIPAKPTLEFNLGYSTAAFNAGPVGDANGSAFWPGAVIAGGGSQLPLLIDPYLEQYGGPLAPVLEPLVPTFGAWPAQAASAYPQGPATASNNNGPVSMSSSSDQNQSSASSSLGQVGGPASQSALPAGMLTVQAITSNTSATVDNTGNAVSTATSALHSINFAAGIVQIGAITSTATSISDGNQAKVTGSTSVVGASIAGQPVSIDSNGVHVMGNTQNLLGSLVPSVNQILSTAGITISVTNPTDTVQGPSAQRQLDGLSVTINLSTYDKNLTQLIAMLPSQLTSGLSQLPIPTPYQQVVTFDLGWVNASSAASPPFTLSLGDLGNGAGGGVLAGLSPSEGSSFTPTDTGTTSTPASSALPQVSAAPVHASPVALFKGVGTGLVVLGAILAALLVGLLMGTDRAVGKLAEAVPCVGEDVGRLS